MAHIRKQIRDAFALAVTGLTTTGSNVFIGRVEPIEMAKTPALVIFTPDDEREAGAGGPVPRTYHRIITIEVIGETYQADPIDLLDTIAVEVETAAAADITLGGICQDLTLRGSEITLTGESAQPSGVIIMQFLARYHHKENTPEVAI
jgi:hypothetical protein